MFEKMDQKAKEANDPKTKLLDFEKQIREMAKKEGMQPRNFLIKIAEKYPQIAKNRVIQHLIGEKDSMGMNKYGLSASKIGGKFVSYRHGKKTGEFDSMEELAKHQKELIANEDDVPTQKGRDAKSNVLTPRAMNTVKKQIKKDANKQRRIDGKSAIAKALHDDTDEDYGYVKMIINQNPKEYAKMKETGDLMDAPTIYEKLFQYFAFDTGEMPYGTAKARDGDPYVWIADKLADLGLDEGNEFAQKVRQMKAAGAKKGTKFKTSDGEEHTLEQDDANKKAALEAWYNKYKKYEGNNGDELPQGMLKGHIDTGILTDGVEANEFAKAVAKFGGDRDKAEQALFDNEKLFSKHLPITDAMQNDYMRAMGVSEIDEENCTEAAKILGEDIVGFGIAEDEDLPAFLKQAKKKEKEEKQKQAELDKKTDSARMTTAHTNEVADPKDALKHLQSLLLDPKIQKDKQFWMYVKSRYDKLKATGESIEEDSHMKSIGIIDKYADELGPDSMDYDLFKKTVALLKAGKLEELGKLLYDSDTEPREYLMKVIADNDEEIFKKMYGDQDGYFSLMKPVGMEEDALQEDAKITEEEFEQLAEKKDACYHKVKARYKVWPSAYASGALVQCRKKGAANWGNSKK